jgi:hypothetical protein
MLNYAVLGAGNQRWRINISTNGWALNGGVDGSSVATITNGYTLVTHDYLYSL